MLIVLSSLAFLLALGVAVSAVAAVLIDDGHKIMAALAGRSLLSHSIPVRSVTMRFSQRYSAQAQRPLHATPELRVAA